MDGSKVVRPELDDVRDWSKDFSPGQMQRLAFARLFFHRPSFVILDECTNGINPEVEHSLYDRCSNMNLAVFSISHKIELKLFHDYELHYKGDASGSWSMRKCTETIGKITRSSSTVHAQPCVTPGPETKRLPGQSIIHYERQHIDQRDASPKSARRALSAGSFGELGR